MGGNALRHAKDLRERERERERRIETRKRPEGIVGGDWVREGSVQWYRRIPFYLADLDLLPAAGGCSCSVGER